MKKILIIALYFIYLVSFSQKIDLNKSILVIPDSLTENANSVVRYYKTDVVIKSEKSMVVNYKKLITILNKSGDDIFFVESYNKYTSINNIEISIYNELGKRIKKVKNKDIKDVASSDDNYTLFSDYRYKYYKYIPNSYPYTIEINYSVKTSNTAFIPKWYAYKDYNKSVESDEYSITFPENLILNKKEINLNNCLVLKKEGNNKFSYTVKNLKALKAEPYSLPFYKISPNVSFSLNKFSLAGEIGDASSWNNFGKWMNDKLLKNRNEIPQSTKNDIKNLVKGVDNPIERAKLVYQYMQNRTRYISIQIGIGGWKPMLAEDVDRLRYGDCKALSYYTKSLLDEADVKSSYTIVWSGDKKNIEKDFVSVQGNHAILMVPSKKDTIWLECTSQKLPFGQTGSTDDRDVLIISNDVGKIVHTNKYEPTYNYQKINGEIFIDSKGDLKSDIEIVSSGKQYNNHFGISFKDKKEQVKYYKDLFSNLIDLKVDKINFNNNKDEVIFTEELSLNSINYSELIGDDMIIKLNAFNIYDNLPKRIKNRTQPLIVKFGYLDEDEIIINIPKNYKVDILPKPIEISNKFGKYSSKVSKINDNKILYKRVLNIKNGEYLNTDYNLYRKFLKEIIKHDKQKIIVTK